MPGSCRGASGCTGATLRAGSCWMLVTNHLLPNSGDAPPWDAGQSLDPCRDDRSLTRVAYVVQHRFSSSHQ